MKILIDATWRNIYRWENGRKGEKIFSGNHLAIETFEGMIDKILTPSQCEKWVNSINDNAYTLSKKKEKILFEIIAKYS